MDLQYDFLVVGSGIAGLTYALKVADHGSVAIITKDLPQESNTAYAQGGIAGVWQEPDNFNKVFEYQVFALLRQVATTILNSHLQKQR